MKHYTVELEHDHGVVRIGTVASSWVRAVDIVLKAELAPASAVLSVKEKAMYG